MSTSDFVFIGLIGFVLVCINQAITAYRVKRSRPQVEASFRATLADYHLWSVKDKEISKRIRRLEDRRSKLTGIAIYIEYHELSLLIVDLKLDRLLLRQSFTGEELATNIEKLRCHRSRIYKKRSDIAAEGYPWSRKIFNKHVTVIQDSLAH